ncbi:MAG: 2-keto-4-pentenoate hydratase [Xanthomonadales bacterium]|nr:2-keto-4-pentenoate hydratase [Xanthomonadales bacterium]
MSSEPSAPTQRDADLTVLDTAAVARALVGARQGLQPLRQFPGGRLPPTMAAGYAIQDQAIGLWPDRIIGWKVGYIAPERRDEEGDERVIGPIFASALWPDLGRCLPFPVFVDGFAAVEAEYVFELAADVPPDHLHWTPAEAAAMVAGLYIGVETAGSPMAQINVWGPTVVASDFGNNAGLILGRRIDEWPQIDEATLQCHCEIEGQRVGSGGASRIPGGLLGSLAFALGKTARRSLPMQRGMLITTGAATGIHDIVAGQHSRIDFGQWGAIECRAVAATPATVPGMPA